jgi:DNA primase
VSRIAADSVEQVKAAVDMVDLVSGKTQLRRSGGRFTGLCPFHQEKTPSFSVDPVQKLYKCFGCGEGGDAIDFVEKTEGLDFTTAIEWLAGRYGVTLEYEESSPQAAKRRDERRRLGELLETAATFYERFLWESAEAEPAREYLAERGIAEQSARDFRVGFSPRAWDRVCRAALDRGFTADELTRAGLSSRGRRGPVDRFRGRLMFPLADARGRVVGFGARQMPGGDAPKYLNSPESALFTKSSLLYGLDRARRQITAEGRATVVEGYTDVIAMHQAGLTTAVASMGTALTAAQVVELRRLADTVVLAFDADAAGGAATLKGMELARREQLTVLVAELPEGRDPADLAIDDLEGLRRALAAATGLLTFRVRHLLAGSGTRDQRYDAVRAVLAAESPSVERDEAVRMVAGRLELTDELAAALVRPASNGDGRAPRATRSARLSPRQRDERLFLAMCLLLPDDASALLPALEMANFSDAVHWEAATVVRRHLAGELSVQESHEKASLLADLTALAAREQASKRALEELFWKLQLHRVDTELKTLRDSADLDLSRSQLQELLAQRLSIQERLEAIRGQVPQE